MLGSNFELTAYVMLAKLSEKCIVLIGNKVVITDTASYKYLFHLGKCPEFAKKFNIILMTDLGIGAD